MEYIEKILPKIPIIFNKKRLNIDLDIPANLIEKSIIHVIN